MLDLSTLLVFAGALAVTTGSPGPSIAAMTARVLSRGLRPTLPFLAAMWLGEGIWLTCAVLGLAAIAQTAGWAFVIIKWLGVGYLLYLAYEMWRADDSPEADAAAALPRRGEGWRLFFAGLGVTLGNPKIMLFYVALLPSLVELSSISLGGWAALLVVTLMVVTVVDLTWALAADQARAFFRSRRARRAANRASAVCVGGAAAMIAAR